MACETQISPHQRLNDSCMAHLWRKVRVAGGICHRLSGFCRFAGKPQPQPVSFRSVVVYHAVSGSLSRWARWSAGQRRVAAHTGCRPARPGEIQVIGVAVAAWQRVTAEVRFQHSCFRRNGGIPGTVYQFNQLRIGFE